LPVKFFPLALPSLILEYDDLLSLPEGSKVRTNASTTLRQAQGDKEEPEIYRLSLIATLVAIFHF
jgi:hypothetical protein